MWEQLDQILRQAAQQIGEQLAGALPNILAALVLLLATLIAAIVARLLLVRILHSLEFDRHAERLGLVGAAVKGATPPSLAVARAGQWMILLLGGLVSLTALDADLISRLAVSVFEYVPHFLAALLIVLVGTLVARFLAQSVLIGAVNMQLPFARLISVSVKWLVLLVTIAMALEHLAIGRTILVLAFGMIFGGLVLAMALAVGLGARDAVAKAIERQTTRPADRENHLDHV